MLTPAEKEKHTSVWVTMCYAGRLWVRKIAAAADCSSPLERSDVVGELRTIVRAVRVVEVSGEGPKHASEGSLIQLCIQAKPNGSDIWGGPKLRLPWLRTVVIDDPTLHQHRRASMYERRTGKHNASRQGSRPQ